MDYAKKAARRAVIVFVVSIMAAFLGFLIRMVLARGLTPSEYGLFFGVFTLIFVTKVIRDMGLDQAIVKYIPEFQVKGKLESIKNTIVTAYTLQLTVSIVFAVILIALSSFLAKNYFKNELAKPIIIVFSIIMIVSIFKQNLRQIFNGFQKMTVYALIYFSENLFILLFIFLFFYFKLGIFSPLLAYLGAYILIFLLFLPVLFKTFPLFKYKSRISKKLTKKLLKFGLPLTVSGIGDSIILYTDTLVLTYFASLKEVGIYNVVVPTAMLLAFFGSSIGQVIFPMISEMYAKNLKENIVKGINKLLKYSFLIIVPVALVMFSFPELLLKLLFGKEYIGGALTLQVLVIGLIFLVITRINIDILKGIGKPKLVTKIMLIGALVNLILNFYFIPRYGMLGAGATSLASYCLILIVSLFYLRQNIKFKFEISNWIKILVSGIFFVIIIQVIKTTISLNVYIESVVSVFLAGTVYLAMIYLLKVVDIEEILHLLKN